MGQKYRILYKNYDGEQCWQEYQTSVLIKALFKLCVLISKFDIVDFNYRKVD